MPERHNFSNLPLRVSGRSVVARLRGECTLIQHGDSVLMRDLMLYAEDGGLIEIAPTELIWGLVFTELQKQVPESPAPPIASESYNSKEPLDLDNVQIEGARSA